MMDGLWLGVFSEEPSVERVVFDEGSLLAHPFLMSTPVYLSVEVNSDVQLLHLLSRVAHHVACSTVAFSVHTRASPWLENTFGCLNEDSCMCMHPCTQSLRPFCMLWPG